MRLIDLCCGAGGLTAGAQAACWQVMGVDVVARKDYPAPVLRGDVRTLDPALLPPADWVHASPPCTRFSSARASRVNDPPTEADLDILQACLQLRDAIKPRYWTVENVRGAVDLFSAVLGPPKMEHGPFIFWGNFPPFLVGRSGIHKAMSTVLRNQKGAHRSPWLRAKVPAEIATPLASAIAQALQTEGIVGGAE